MNLGNITDKIKPGSAFFSFIATVASLIFILHLSTYFTNYSYLLLLFFGVLLLGNLFLPIPTMLLLMFFYLNIEGFLKIISNYNPVIHVGVDIYAGIIFIKVLVSTLDDKELVKKFPPLTLLIVLHFIWFVIAFLNPYQLNIFASLAGTKMYVNMVLLFFFGYFYTSSAKDVKKYMFPWILGLFLHTTFSIYQGVLGKSSVLAIHPGYNGPLSKFAGYAFRPFGFTALPGGPSAFIFLTMSFLLYYLVFSKRFSIKLLFVGILSSAWITLFLCQVRSAIIKSILSSTLFFAFYFFTKNKSQEKSSQSQTLQIVVIALLLAVGLKTGFDWITSSNVETTRALERSNKAFDLESMSGARRNALNQFFIFIQKVPLGAGLSRTGAAAGKFQEDIASGGFFREGFFTDNFWLAVIVDLGIPGMILITLIVFLILYYGHINRKKMMDYELKMLNHVIWCSLIASVAGFYGAESILYNPEAAFFWFFSGVMLKLPEIDRDSFYNDINDIYEVTKNESDDLDLQMR